MSVAVRVAPSFVRRPPRLPYRALALVAAVGVAYHFSLQSLLVGLNLQTPLGYLALVPVLALLIGASSFMTQPRLRPIHDRQLDWIVGIGFLAAAATIEAIMPSAFSADFWLYRIDLLGLPLFAAGAISVLYGVRRLWALRWAVLFLVLAWPVPYETVLASAIGASTSASIGVVGAITQVVPLAQPVGEGTFLLSHGGSSFAVSIGSACSGINSLVGFLLLGLAWNAVLTGGVVRRLAWLAAGSVIVGALNIARIELIFLAGGLFGAPFAFDVLHPVAGVIVFGLGALLMFGLAGRFGLQLKASPATDWGAGSPPPLAAPSGLRSRRDRVRGATRRVAPAVACLAAGLLFAVPNNALAGYDRLVDGFGQPSLAAIDPSRVSVAGWSGSAPTTFGQADQFFGPHATWERIAFSATAPVAGPGVTYLDVIRTDQGASLAAYGVEQCYDFHGFSQAAYRVVDIGAGVDARLASYRSPDGGTDWSILWWEWPYDGGGQTRFERMVLLAPIDSSVAAASHGAASGPDFGQADVSLTTVGRSIVAQAMASHADTASEVQP